MSKFAVGDRVQGFSEEGKFYRGTYLETKENGEILIEDVSTAYHIYRLSPETVQFVTAMGSDSSLEKSSRQEILNEAGTLIHSDRNKSYGEPTQNFQDTATLWNTVFAHKLKENFSSSDVAVALILLKTARMKASPKRDNWVDVVGYAACGAECDIAEGRIE